MMQHGNCRCPHHVVAKVLVGLGWLSALAFLCATWKSRLVINLDATDWFYHSVIFVLLAFSTKFCGCCARHWMIGKSGMGGMNCACNCGECVGGKCGGNHNEEHKHM